MNQIDDIILKKIKLQHRSLFNCYNINIEEFKKGVGTNFSNLPYKGIDLYDLVNKKVFEIK